MEEEKTNLPRLKRYHQHLNQPEQTEGQITEPSSPSKDRSSRIKKLIRNSGEKKPHRHHYPGSTPLNDNFDLNNPPNQKKFEVSVDNNNTNKQECQARLIPLKVPKRPKRWRHLLDKKPTNRYLQSTKVDLSSDTINEMVMAKGIMVFSSEGEKSMEEREREAKERQEKREKEEEIAKLKREREIALQELETRRRIEAEKIAKREEEEEKKLCEQQLQILRNNAIIDEDHHSSGQTESIQERLEKSRNKK